MKITNKLTLCMSAAALLLFGGYGIHLVHSETEQLHHTAEQEIRLLGRSVQIALENALRDQQSADVGETLAQLELVEPGLDLFVFDAKGNLTISTGNPQPWANAMGSDLRFDPPDDPQRLLLTLPLRKDDGSPLGSMVVSRPLDDLRQDIIATRRSVVLLVAAFVAITWVLGLLLGRTLIGRPLNRLARAMERVRSGDLTGVSIVNRNDEVATLARQFNAMVADLREARRRLEAESESKRTLERGLERTNKLVTIGQLSAGLAHEIGSPLQIVNGRARALLARAHDPQETRRNAEILVAQTDRIARIVTQLLQFARHKPANKIPLDLEPTVGAVLALLQLEIKRHGLKLEFAADPQLPRIHADPDQVQQLILNLVTNAVAATPRGGRIWVALKCGGLLRREGAGATPSVRLLVRDTGRGISAETHARLFEPFFTTREAQGGTGLGLAVVKAIVTEHGGLVAVESEPDRGSAFIVDLPVSEASWEIIEGKDAGYAEEEAHPGSGR